MNFEHLFYFIMKNFNKIKNRKAYVTFLKNEYDIFKIKKEKLKLGKVALEVKTTFLGNIPVFETMEMVYTRQDNTVENELKLENRLKALDWKWNLDNVLAFIIVASFILTYLYIQVYDWLLIDFPSIVERDPKRDSLLKFNFYCLYGSPDLIKFETFKASSYWIYETICDLAMKLNII